MQHKDGLEKKVKKQIFAYNFDVHFYFRLLKLTVSDRAGS